MSIFRPSRRILTPDLLGKLESPGDFLSPWWRLPRQRIRIICPRCGRPVQRHQQRQQNMGRLFTAAGMAFGLQGIQFAPAFPVPSGNCTGCCPPPTPCTTNKYINFTITVYTDSTYSTVAWSSPVTTILGNSYGYLLYSFTGSSYGNPSEFEINVTATYPMSGDAQIKFQLDGGAGPSYAYAYSNQSGGTPGDQVMGAFSDIPPATYYPGSETIYAGFSDISISPAPGPCATCSSITSCPSTFTVSISNSPELEGQPPNGTFTFSKSGSTYTASSAGNTMTIACGQENIAGTETYSVWGFENVYETFYSTTAAAPINNSNCPPNGAWTTNLIGEIASFSDIFQIVVSGA